MSGFRAKMQWIAAAVLVAGLAVGTGSANAQSTRRQRRETNANRKARIARTIKDTYTHQQEVFGGGGYLRWRSGEYLKKNNEITWAVNDTYFLNEKFGITAAAEGAFGDAKIPNVSVVDGDYRPQINEYFFTGGPTYRFLLREKYSVSGVVTGGIGWGIFSGGAGGQPSTEIGMWPSGFKPAITAGVNLDYNLYPNLAFRATPTWIGTTFGSGIQSNVGFNLGFVYRFGRMK